MNLEIDQLPPANDNSATPVPSRRIVRIASCLLLLAALLLLIGVPIGMAYTYWCDAGMIRVTVAMACVGVACLLICGIVAVIIRKSR